MVGLFWTQCDLNTSFESEMNPRKTKVLRYSIEETSSLNTSCFDYNCLRQTFCFHHWSVKHVQHVTAHFERAQPAEEVKPTLPLLTGGSGVEGPAQLVIQVDTQVPVTRHQINIRFQSLRSRLRPYRARSPSARWGEVSVRFAKNWTQCSGLCQYVSWTQIGDLCAWSLLLQDFNIQILHKKSIENIITDTL